MAGRGRVSVAEEVKSVRKAVQPVGNVHFFLVCCIDVEETRTESDSWPAFFFFFCCCCCWFNFSPLLSVTIYCELEERRRVWHKRRWQTEIALLDILLSAQNKHNVTRQQARHNTKHFLSFFFLLLFHSLASPSHPSSVQWTDVEDGRIDR